MSTPITDTYTPSTPRQQHERYRAMIEIQPPPVVKPPSWTPLYATIAIVGVALFIALLAVTVSGAGA